MKRVVVNERPDWQADAEACGFTIHSMYGERYWDERHAYLFTLDEIETRLEDPSATLLQMCYSAVDRIVADPGLMSRMAIPPEYHDAIARSWLNRERDLYGRFDLAYGGDGPAKLLEFNADTPTSLFESAVFQWRWLEDMKGRGEIPRTADQFNSIHERLIDALRFLTGPSGRMHFAGILESEEDLVTLNYLVDCAVQAGCETTLLGMADIGVDAKHWLTDLQDRRIDCLFKLYPLEDMVREPFARHLPATPTRVIEPLWKLTLSNKGLLPVLWDMFPDHENLLPAYFDDDPRAESLGWTYVRKPLLSREGANVTLVNHQADGGNYRVDGPYGAEGYVRQAMRLLPRFGDDWTVIGSWIVAGQPAGIGIREDDTPVTRDTSRFVPHYILD
ncbi:glutathionylspermidine synthase family protein [Rhizobium mayense]|uniref:Glutathionylspermidine synthase family protein n=1 Tax=Rhizobium mayense TaxID=1312184 RepID=A0ABT7JM21_9HYPH|nr:glutathionylspermidine synthase family protein [Rhizobium mayense]MDL2397396.1 glutathionylspermidine synthase family protein [Rhizobium mayense]